MPFTYSILKNAKFTSLFLISLILWAVD